MTHSCTRISRAACLWACVGLALGTDLWAQPADTPPQVVGFATSFEHLRAIATPGARVIVTNAAGEQVSGRIAELSSSSLSITANGNRHDFAERDIASIRERRDDSLANGARRGFAIGAGLGALAIATCDCGVSAAQLLLASTYAGAFAAGLGVGIDAMIRGDQVIYRPGLTSSRRVTVTPVLTRSGAGVSLSLGF